MENKLRIGQLWSLRDQEVVVCLTRDASAAQPHTFIATVVLTEEEEPSWKQGQEVIVHTSGLSHEWTPQPLTGVTR